MAPSSVSELVAAVHSMPHLLAVGAQTKPRLSVLNVPKLSTTRLRGIIEYEPSEFTFTALAGTPVRDIAAALAERGQYLPFDPLWGEAGATLGGTVAAGLSGPGRFRFGGVRDFILGVRFVDGAGRLLRLGGKVVKNAAGFDLPKFFVGSLGRFGVLAEITFKVFPRPAASLTLALSCSSRRKEAPPEKSEIRNPKSEIETAARMMMDIANSRWEAEALDLLPDGQTLCVRLAGPTPALEKISSEILSRWPGRILPQTEAEAVWSGLCEFRWAYPEGPLLKVPLTPVALPSLAEALASLDGTRVHTSAGGSVAFISLSSGDQAARLDQHLRSLGLSGIALRGDGPLWYGAQSRTRIALAVKEALDSQNRFPSLED